MNWQELFENVAYTIMDCIESCFNGMSVAKGKRSVEVFIVCLIFLASSVVLRIVELPAFITWQEALPAVIISAYLAFMDIINASVGNVVKKQLKKGKGGKDESR